MTGVSDQAVINMDISSTSPRLLYISDVPVEASYHGSALLYRLLQTWPADRLVVIEAGLYASLPERRLPGVDYRTPLLPLRRLHSTRFWSWYSALCLRGAKWRARAFLQTARAIKPDAILTVTHGYSWIIAAEVARRLGVPLHLICHDEWAGVGEMQDWKDGVFGEIYRAAASRLCVSPYMVEDYRRRHGVEGTVLYPSRAPDAPRFDAPPRRLGENDGPFTCVFAGTINTPGFAKSLRDLAAALASIGGRLLIHGPLTAEAARASGLDADNIELGGLVSPARLLDILRERADALFAPMSFDAADRSNMEIAFPSKLTDYTSVGVPMLIHGPAYCSAVRWASREAGVAEVVTEEGVELLAAAVSRLSTDARHRVRLSETALAVGDKYFSHEAGTRAFHCALVRRPAPAPAEQNQ